MEKYMLKKMLTLVGFTNGEAQITIGSNNANMLAMMGAAIYLDHAKNKDLFIHLYPAKLFYE